MESVFSTSWKRKSAMPRYKLTPEAKADLQNIARKSEQDFGKAQRLKYIQGLRKKAQNLAEKPHHRTTTRRPFSGVEK